MKKTMMLAAAMKYLKTMDERKEMMLTKERMNMTYTEVTGGTIERPEYDFAATQQALDLIDTTVRNIRHAINAANATSTVEGTDMTVDQILIAMAQINNRLPQLSRMARTQEKTYAGYPGMDTLPTVNHTNFNPKDVNKVYFDLRDKLSKYQMALDLHNLSTSISFDVPEELVA